MELELLDLEEEELLLLELAKRQRRKRRWSGRSQIKHLPDSTCAKQETGMASTVEEIAAASMPTVSRATEKRKWQEEDQVDVLQEEDQDDLLQEEDQDDVLQEEDQ